MATVLERLREALAPEYEVQREIARGGMGMVFLAWEVMLDRQVAIKIIRPELATARAAEKFLSEARILANLRHPNVISVHRAERSGGFFYYVMDYIAGETLADRLAGGPLKPHEALRLGRDLLDALDAVHGMGVVHRDIKPSNIIIVGGRAILTDFGIAKPSEEPAGLTDSRGRVVGTIGYMPPEQAYGWKVTARTDLFAVGVVIYEAYTGRRWGDQMPDRRPDWSGIPRKVVPVLRRALIWDPQERWPDATSFRHRLWKTRIHRYRRRTLLLTAGGLVAGAVVAVMVYPGADQRPDTDVAVLPFEAGEGISTELAQTLTNLAETSIKRLFTVTASHEAEDLWERRDRSADRIGKRELLEIGTRFLVHGSVATEQGDTSIELQVILQSGDRRRAGTVHMRGDRNLGQTGYQLGRNIVSIVDPNQESEYRGGLLSEVDEAVRAYVDGLIAFKRNAFETAQDKFLQAWSLDSTFGLAAWWYHNSWRWLITGEPPPYVDLRQLLETQGDDLPDLDRMLIEAQLAQTEDRRIAAYDETVRQYPRNGYAAFLHADEMFTRGPLIGIPLEESTQQLEIAAEKDSTFGPAHLALIWSYLRLGRREQAEASLRRYESVYVQEEEVKNTDPEWFQLFIESRFAPESAGERLSAMVGQRELVEMLSTAFRVIAIWDMAAFQTELADSFLSTDQPLEPEARAHLHEGLGLGLITTGRVAQGLSHIDSAAALFNTDSARLEAAEWRVVMSALGFPGVAADEVERGRNMLLALLNDPASSPRAAWALGVYAAVSGDRDATGRWLESLRATPADSIAERLVTSLVSVDLGSRGMYQQALDLSRELLQYDSAGRGGDPFTRAALHLKRAEWYDSLDKADEADGARLWYEHFEFLGFPEGEAQAAEIDWALSPYARLLRARAARERGDHAKACTHFGRLIELWAAADPAYAPLISEAEEYVRQRCR